MGSNARGGEEVVEVVFMLAADVSLSVQHREVWQLELQWREAVG